LKFDELGDKIVSALEKKSEGVLLDPVKKLVYAKLGIEKDPAGESGLGVPAWDKEPYLYPILFGMIDLKMDQIITARRLEGEVLIQYRRCLHKHYKILSTEQKDENIEKLVDIFRTMAYLYLNTPASGCVSTMMLLMEPHIQNGRAIITELEGQRIDLVTNSSAAGGTWRASRTIDPNDLPVGSSETAKAMRTKVMRDDDDTDVGKRRRKDTTGGGGGGGGGDSKNKDKVKCRKCHKLVLKSEIQNHNQSQCPKRKGAKPGGKGATAPAT